MKKMILFLVVFLPIAYCGAQWQAPSPNARGFVSTGLSFQQWTFETSDKPIREVVAPITVFLPLKKGVYLTCSNTPGTASMDSVRLSGISDTWIRGTYIFPNERFMLTAGIGAPTGKTRLKGDEFVLSQMLGENIFRFRLPVYGQGLSLKVGAGAAFPLQENAVLGAGIHIISHGKFKPVDSDSIEYQMGTETSVFTGVDVQISPRAKWTLNISYTLYGKDKFNGEEIYASGKKLLFNTSLSAALGKGMLYTSLNWRQRGKNEYWIDTGLQTENKNSNGAQTEIDAAWQVPWNPQGSFSLLGTGRFYSKNEYDSGGADVYGGGAGVQYLVSPKTSLQMNLLILTGNTKASDKIKISGLDFMAGLTFGL